MRLPQSSALALLMLAWQSVHACAAGDPDYGRYRQGVFLAFIDPPRDGGHLDSSPRLLISFGGEPRPILMDTGSTGIVVSADRIPNVDGLPSRPGRLVYSSSGRIMIGRWVTTPAEIIGRNGASVDIAPLPVLAVTAIACTARARDCTPEDHPAHVAMMGVGFGREYDGQTESTPDRNPLLNLARTGSDQLRRGYVITRTGVHVGLTRANTRGDFHFIPLERNPSIPGEWKGVPVCITVNRQAPPSCGSGLVDTGVTAMFLTLPPGAVTGATDQDGTPRVGLAPGTMVSFDFPGGASRPAAAHYDLVVGGSSPLAPTEVHLNTTRPEPFVNTGVHFLNGFDYLYDADGGFVGFRASE